MASTQSYCQWQCFSRKKEMKSKEAGAHVEEIASFGSRFKRKLKMFVLPGDWTVSPDKLEGERRLVACYFPGEDTSGVSLPLEERLISYQATDVYRNIT